MHVPRLLIAGVGSGAGKTTVATGLMALWARRGLRVQPFKAGPDYLDPGHHSLAAGRISRNLDSHWFDEDSVLDLFSRGAAGADLAVIEGVMGLFDGAGARDDRGSSAHLARILKAPVILVVDAAGIGRSAAALVYGYASFDRRVDVRGVIFNRVAGPRHYELLREAVAGVAGITVLGYVERDESLRLPERHLGLVPTWERQDSADHLDRLVARLGQTVDTEAARRLAEEAPPLPAAGRRVFPATPPISPTRGEARCRIAVARDRAFHFYYQDGLEFLEACGAQLIPVSLLEDDALPEGIAGLYIGGGFPEIFAADLAANEGMKGSVRRAHRAGMPIYAECGGLMYLSEGIVTASGERHAMAGLVPGCCRMDSRPVAIGYAEGELLNDCILGLRGERVTGHEFHYSRWEVPAATIAGARAYRLRGRFRQGETDGFARGKLLASYLHLHFAANPGTAHRFAGECAAFRRGKASVGVS